MNELQHITPRLTQLQIIENAERDEETRILDSLRRHMVAEWTRQDDARDKREALCFVGVVAAVALAVVLILVTR